MTLFFEGTAHPPPAKVRSNVADLSAAEIATTNMGRTGTSVLVEHDAAAHVGTVHASWESPVDGSLRVVGVVDDPTTAAAVRDGTLRGLSLGTGVTQQVGGKTLLRTQEELSLCADPRRAGCWIDQLDGKTVRRTACFSVAKGTGVSLETHNQVKTELERLREQNAVLKVKQEAQDAVKRETLSTIKPDVNAFIASVVDDERNAPFKHELAPMTRWAGDMDTAETIDTNLSIGRLISCASAKFKHTTEQASQLKASADLVAQKSKRVDELEEDNAKKAARITELTGLLEERTGAATAMSEELARAGLMQDKFDFSNRAARENVDDASAAGSKAAGKQPMAAATAVRAPNMDDALFSFLSNGRGASGKRLTPSATGHSFLGASGSGDGNIASAIAAA